MPGGTIWDPRQVLFRNGGEMDDDSMKTRVVLWWTILPRDINLRAGLNFKLSSGPKRTLLISSFLVSESAFYSFDRTPGCAGGFVPHLEVSRYREVT